MTEIVGGILLLVVTIFYGLIAYCVYKDSKRRRK